MWPLQLCTEGVRHSARILGGNLLVFSNPGGIKNEIRDIGAKRDLMRSLRRTRVSFNLFMTFLRVLLLLENWVGPQMGLTLVELRVIRVW